MPLKKTPLHKICLSNGARMVPFAGWEMPIQFSGLINEHKAVRNHAGLFDISHMGALSITGVNAKNAMQVLVPTDLHRIGPGESCYTVLLNKNGGIIDDLIIYDLGVDKKNNESLLVIINSACIELDSDWIRQHLDKNISMKNAKENGILIAIQGPKAKQYLTKYFGQSIDALPRFGHKRLQAKINDLKINSSIFISRTGYTGEDGFEILLDETSGTKIWLDLIHQGITPCGLGARDTLRLEAAMHLYGNDMNQETTPFEAGLGWLVHLEMPKEFIGRQALEKQCQEGTRKQLVGLEINGRGIARKGYQIIYQNEIVGEITSGTWSPTLQKGIALAYLPKALVKTGTQINVKIREQLFEACVVKKPFYRRVS